MAKIKRNDKGYRIGESHHRATIPDAVVHELRDLYTNKKLRIEQLIELFENRDPPVRLRYRTVRKIISGERRKAPCTP